MFLEKYKEKTTNDLEFILGRKLTQKEISHIESKMKNFKDKRVALVNTRQGKRKIGKLSEILDWYTKEEPIVSGFGTFFHKQQDYHSIVCDLVLFLMNHRDVIKKQMFKEIESGKAKSHPAVKALDQEQKIIKLLANSFYGAYSEKGFIFYDPDAGPSVTYTGRWVIGSMMYGFETFLTGNAYFESKNELLLFIRKSLSNHSYVEKGLGSNPYFEKVTKNDVINHVQKMCKPDVITNEEIETYLDMFSEEQYKTLYLKGNPYIFFHFEEIKKHIFKVLEGKPIQEADAKHIEKESLDELETINYYLNEYVAFNHTPFNLTERITKMKRRAVIVVDTDSTFLTLDPWLNLISEYVDLKECEDQDKLFIMNIMVFLLRRFSDSVMHMLTTNSNIPEDYKKYLLFKSEFVYPRILVTNGKKHYAGLITYQEGKQLANGGDIDIKGLAIKKVGTAKETREKFTSILEHNILRSEKVDVIKVIKETLDFKDLIKSSLENGEPRFLIPSKMGSMSKYKNPYTLAQVRGCIGWNILNPQLPIQEEESILLIKLDIGTDEMKLLKSIILSIPDEKRKTLLLEKLESTNYDSIEDFLDEDNKFTEEINIEDYEKIVEKFFDVNGNEDIIKNGLNWYALPRSVKEIPKWIIPSIDMAGMIQSNISPGYPILESCNIQILRLPEDEVSTLIKF